MARTDDDSWDLATSVGATATMVAAARALASSTPDPLIDDPFAAPLVRAVGIEFFARLLDGDIPWPQSGGPQVDPAGVIDVLAVRTKFFDDFFRTSTEGDNSATATAGGNPADAAAGIRQAVILASGLDSRAYRLSWPAGTVVFEIDQQTVIDFKTATLAGLGAHPRAQHRPVPVDLRDDWPAALRANGFDDTRPSAWSAEGLLAYLPPESQDRLFDEITALSAPGSRVATEYHPHGPAAIAERNRVMAQQWKDRGFELDLGTLMYPGERTPPSEYLAGHGWRVSTQTRAELFAVYGRNLPTDDTSSELRETIAVTAIRD
ncbi:MAG: class I SAM-dependent methyltransferase [Mycobacteriaceae bacterium]|nr:class I SAM-dependent methyltransferase [Mycobacteriaceae bacterium]